MERRPVGNPYHRAFRVCGGNFPEHALRHPGNAGDFSPAGGQHLLCRISPMATVIRYGIFASPLVFGSAHARPAHFWTAQHGQCWILRHSRWLGRRFRDSHFWTLSASTYRRRVASSGHCHIDCKTWPGHIFWCAHNCCWFSRARAQRIDGLLSTRGADRNWHFRGRPFYVLNCISIHPRTAAAGTPRLDLRGRSEICAVECPPAGAHSDLFKRISVVADCNRLFAHSTASLRGKRTVTRTEKQSRESCSSKDHAKNADALGTRARNRACEQCATIA